MFDISDPDSNILCEIPLYWVFFHNELKAQKNIIFGEDTMFDSANNGNGIVWESQQQESKEIGIYIPRQTLFFPRVT